jgi:hypothetical protein
MEMLPALTEQTRYTESKDCSLVRDVPLLDSLLGNPNAFVRGPPLWSSGQSSWLQIRRLGFDSRHYKKKVVGLERGPLNLVSTTEELLDRKVVAPV